MTTWIYGANGNRVSVEKYGTEAAARASLDTLKNCSDCLLCSGCSRCLLCAHCERCEESSDYSYCYGTTHGPPPVPKIENIHVLVYAAASQPGALDVRAWHGCDNTHCRAGWVIALAGEEGRRLEEFYDTALVAMMIYDESDPSFKINPTRFFDDNDTALSDMRRLAGVEELVT